MFKLYESKQQYQEFKAFSCTGMVKCHTRWTTVPSFEVALASILMWHIHPLVVNIAPTHIMVEEILNQWSGSDFCDLHLTISICHTEKKTN